MATQTGIRTEIKETALTALGVLAVGETATTADLAAADKALDRLIDELEMTGAIGFGKTAISETAKGPLAALLADDLALAFGVSADRAGTLAQRAIGARRSLAADAQAEGATTLFANY